MRRRTKWLLALLVLVIILAVVGIRPNILPPTEYSQHANCVCTECGVYGSIYKEGKIGDPFPLLVKEEELHDNPLSKWFSQHYADHSIHQWRPCYGSGTKYAFIGTFRFVRVEYDFSYGHGPALCDLEKVDNDILDKLYDQDPINCRNYIRLRLDNDSRALDPAEIEESLRRDDLPVTPHASTTPAALTIKDSLAK